jgi:hypothetical protein
MGFDFAAVVWPQSFAKLSMHAIKYLNKIILLLCKSIFGIMVGMPDSP